MVFGVNVNVVHIHTSYTLLSMNCSITSSDISDLAIRYVSSISFGAGTEIRHFSHQLDCKSYASVSISGVYCGSLSARLF